MSIRVLETEDLKKVLKIGEVIEGVRSVYEAKADGEIIVWPLIYDEFNDGKGSNMDIRSGGIKGDINIHGMKMFNEFPGNHELGIPSHLAYIMVFDSTNGMPLGVVDGAYVTGMRTGSAGAIGADALARKDARTLMILGAGQQAMFQIAATLTLRPEIEKVWIADPVNQPNAEQFAANCRERLSKEFGINAENTEFKPVTDLKEAVGEADIVITVTPSREPVIKAEWVKPGTHFSCIGSDMEGKEEIDPEIFRGAKVYGDDLAQCIRVGEMEIPLKKGTIREEELMGEIGQLLKGEIEGRTSDEEITIFDATGISALDLITAKIALEA